MYLEAFVLCTISTNQLRFLWQLVNLSNAWLQYILFVAALFNTSKVKLPMFIVLLLSFKWYLNVFHLPAYYLSIHSRLSIFAHFVMFTCREVVSVYLLVWVVWVCLPLCVYEPWQRRQVPRVCVCVLLKWALNELARLNSQMAAAFSIILPAIKLNIDTLNHANSHYIENQ